jgi:Planctomycete cytochrome C
MKKQNMKLKLTVLFAGLVTLALPALADDIDVSKLPPASDKKGLTYEHDIQPLLKASCFGCHGEQRQSGGVRLDSVEAIMKGGRRGSVIVTPGKGETSQIVISTSRLDPKTAMPPPPRAPRGGMGGTNAPAGGTNGMAGTPPPGGGPPQPGRGGPPAKPLTAEEVGLIRAWIDQGAK